MERKGFKKKQGSHEEKILHNGCKHIKVYIKFTFLRLNASRLKVITKPIIKLLDINFFNIND
jgi:hypothetical protein